MNIMLTICSMSVSASVMFLFYLAARRMLRRHLPASVCYALLLVILLRLLVPYSPAFALMNFLYHRQAAHAEKTVPTASLSVADEGSDTDSTLAGHNATYQASQTEQGEIRGNTAPYTESAAPSEGSQREFPWSAAILAVWLTGATGIFGVNVAAYLFCRRRILREADYSVIHTQILADIARGRHYPDVFLSKRADTPMVLGAVIPVIVLPYEDYTLAEVKHILRHELCHYRRFDVGFKWLSVAACSLHWCNPLMPLFRGELEDACECSCDAAVTRSMDAAERKAYIRTLLKTAARQVNANMVPLTAMSGSAKRLDERFAAIAAQKRLTPARAVLSVTAIVAAAAMGLSLGACTFPTTPKQGTKADTFADPVTQDNTVIHYAAYDYGFQSMGFEVTDPDAYYDEKKQTWRRPKENTNYDTKPTRVGGTLQRSELHNVYKLLHFEQYERIGEVQSFALFGEDDAMEVDFWTDELHYDTLYFYLKKGGNMYVCLNHGKESDLYHPDSYRDYPDYLKSSHSYSVFDVPDDLYDKVASLLYPLAEISAQGGLAELMAGLREDFPSDEIGNDYVYAVISGKMRIMSDDFGCDFYASVGDSTYQLIWSSFKGIGQYNEIQPRPALAKTDEHIMIIGTDDYGETYVDEYISIYADSGVICVRFKGDEIWYSVPKDWVKACGEIAALQM